ncbi:DMT family transporter [Petroclostridium sp. X23]|uniref:DMT family transporter n=1 Tax=Petroclostridium sp. X23 TaxID=3045146 RepID=UPI0024AD6E4D|nr:DMT family transporter [Petroclostridium sp. X23]WHH59256.1 DMT family transporter [Petroclostridium sp. X23]
MQNFSIGIVQVLIAAFLWSTGGVFIKAIDADPIFIAAARSAIAGLILLPFIDFKKLRFSFGLAALLVSYAYTLCSFVIATKLTASANAIAIQYTAPLWLFIFTVIMTKKVSLARIIPMAFIGGGILFFLMEPVSGTNAAGNLMALSSGIGFAALSYFMSKPQCIAGVGLISLCNLTAALCMVLFIPYPISVSSISTVGWMSLAYLGIFQIGIAYIFYGKALETVAPLKATIIALIEPILNPIWVVIFIHEIPTIYALFGGVSILIGILLDIKASNSTPRENVSVSNS